MTDCSGQTGAACRGLLGDFPVGFQRPSSTRWFLTGNFLSSAEESAYFSAVAFPQYRIPISRLKEEWTFRLRMDRLRRKRPPIPLSKITDNSEPWIRNPSSVAEFREIARRVNETVATWSPPQDNSSLP